MNRFLAALLHGKGALRPCAERNGTVTAPWLNTLCVLSLSTMLSTMAVARDGLPATDFGNAGSVEIPLPAETVVRLLDSEIDSAGRVLIVGRRTDASGGRGFVLRLLPNGDLDSGFAENGWFVLPTLPALGFAANTGTAFAAVSSGPQGLFLAGYPTHGDGRTCALVVALTEAGALRSDFGTSGSGAVCGPAGLPNGELTLPSNHLPRIGLIVRGQQLLVSVARLHGTAYAYPQAEWIHALTLSGVPDAGFGTAGLITLGSGRAGGLAVDAAGRLVVSGSTGSGLFFERRLLPTGNLDPSFGQSGLTVIPYPTVGFYGEPMQTWTMLDDRPTFSFRKYRDLNGEQSLNYGFLRVTHAGVADTSVATIPADTDVGYVLHPTLIVDELTGYFDTAADRDQFGRVVIAGPEIVRLLPDGHLDTSFGSNGYRDLPQPEQTQFGIRVMQTVTTDPAGNAYVATWESDSQPPNQAVFRVLKFGGDTLLDNGFE